MAVCQSINTGNPVQYDIENRSHRNRWDCHHHTIIRCRSKDHHHKQGWNFDRWNSVRWILKNKSNKWLDHNQCIAYRMWYKTDRFLLRWGKILLNKKNNLSNHMKSIGNRIMNKKHRTDRLLLKRTLYHTKCTVLCHIVNTQLDKLLNITYKHFLLPNTCLSNNSYNKLLTLCMTDSLSHMVQQYRLMLRRILTLEHKYCLTFLCFGWQNKKCSYWL